MFQGLLLLCYHCAPSERSWLHLAYILLSAALDSGNTPPKSFNLKAEQTQFSQHLFRRDVVQHTNHPSGLHCAQPSMPSPSASECQEHKTSKKFIRSFP